MAQRRMFSKKIVETDYFMEMSPTAKLLYFYLNMSADDDGFVGNPKMIKMLSGATDDDLKILIAKQFIIPFDSGVIVIKDWKIHNYIQKDRYNKTQYTKEKSQLTVEENGMYTKCIHKVSTSDTQVRLGKVRLGKVSKDIVPQSETVPPYKTIIDYLNDKAGTKYRSSSKDTQKHIKARFNNGFTLEDFKSVIDNKVSEWGNNTKMSAYLRPPTLFGTKFESYLNQKGGGESAIYSEDVSKFSNAPVTDDDTLPF
ncbi:conserved phage C-terminal domain-containing protein [Brochothrix thermosphacta]|uniref:conserved phage C-terminal domain-containing protein n=1 Tax=Brochothrix thermosphacta TaxID=2756 RepID=UPI001C4F8F6A|nr:conserved phage C-terminal domain-containing protein [Brochothrix thermosphacta]